MREIVKIHGIGLDKQDAAPIIIQNWMWQHFSAGNAESIMPAMNAMMRWKIIHLKQHQKQNPGRFCADAAVIN